MRIARKPLVVAGCVFAIGSSINRAWPLSLDDVLIDPFEVEGVCKAIEGEHPVSIQPAVQYKMAGQDEAGSAIYGSPTRKMFQSFQCKDAKATIYYYEFGSAEELGKRLDSIKTILWGESAPTKLHPELVMDLENMLVVVSSRSPEFLASIISHRKNFPDISDTTVSDRLSGLRCGTKGESTPEICSALRSFREGTYPPALETELVLVGRSWDIEKSKSSDALTEAFYLGQVQGFGRVASFGRVEPDNEDEKKQILDQLETQKKGKAADSARPLLDFIRDTYGKTRARAVNSSKSLAFIGLGNRVYVRSTREGLVVMTDLMHTGGKRPYVVATFDLGPQVAGEP